MSDNFKINSIFSRLKSHFVRDSYSSSSPAYGASGKKNKDEQQEPEKDQDALISNPANEKLFKLGEELGLSIAEVIESVELILKAISKFPGNTDTAIAILSNDLIKYPQYEGYLSDIPEKVLLEIEQKSPDLHLAISKPFEFMCKYPKTVSLEMYRKFSYTEILDFSRSCPEEYELIKEQATIEREDESSKETS